MAVLSHHDRLGLRWSDARIAVVNGAAFLRACASVMGPPPPRWRITHAKRASAARRTTTTNPATSSSTASIGHMFPDLSSDPALCDRCCPRDTLQAPWDSIKKTGDLEQSSGETRSRSCRSGRTRAGIVGSNAIRTRLGSRRTTNAAPFASPRQGGDAMSRSVMRQSAIGSAIGLATPGRALHPPAPVLS